VASVRDEFYRRLVAAFRFFEARVAQGRLGWYGVSSNTVARPVEDVEATSLARMLRAAEEAGGPGHHFAVLQLPMNLFESGGLTEANNDPEAPAASRRSVLDLARSEGIGVLVNRPLNAFAGRGMIRLADFPAPDAGASGEALAAVAALEAEYRRDVAAHVRVTSDSDRPEDFLRWADQLAGIRGRVAGVTQWEQVESQVHGLVARAVRALDEGLQDGLADTWAAWRDRYLPALQRLLDLLRAEATRSSQRQSAAVARAVDPALPAERRGEPLSRKALWVLASTPGVSAVLVGMRRPAYVDDATAILAWPPVPDVRPVYEAAARVRLPG
jgi:aryl-alcohol dehydrogenase-like predicted oxidoreductase